MLKLVQELYAHKFITSEAGVVIGMTATPGDIRCESKARSTVTAKGPAKISTAILLYDILFGKDSKGKEPRLAVYNCTTADAEIYVVFDGVGYLVQEEEILSTGDPVHHTTQVIPSVLFAMKTDEELKKIFHSAVKRISKNDDPKPDLFKFCDEFYYGYAFNHRVLLYNPGSITEEEVKRLFETGTLEKETFGLPDEVFTKSKYDTSKKAKSKTKKKEAHPFMERALKGEFLINHEWDEEQKSAIVPLDFLKDFVPTEDFKEAVISVNKAVSKGEPINGELFGKPGTGKTTIMMALSAATGLPYYPIVFSKHTEEDVLEGKTRIVNGKPEFVPTDIPKYWDKGGLFDLEEINSADPGVLIAFNMALEAPGIIMRNGYEKVYRSPLSFVFACMNTGIEGTNPMPPALSNRFLRKWRVADPDDGTFKEILSKKTGADPTVISWVYDAYKKVINYLKSPEVGEDELVNLLSMRSCVGAIENMYDGQAPKRAIINSIVNSIAEADLTLGDSIEEEVVSDLRDIKFEI